MKNINGFIKIILAYMILSLTLSCKQETFQAAGLSSSNNESQNQNSTITNDSETDNSQSDNQTNNQNSSNDQSNIEKLYPICPTLNYNHVTWPQDINDYQKIAFKLALNLSGSFEGNSGWSNLSNNFDGMGLSMGLLNQNLGSGSLQPLLIQMAASFPVELRQTFSTDHYNSLMNMLVDWYGKSITPSPLPITISSKINNQQNLLKILSKEDENAVDPQSPDDQLVSPLDDNSLDSQDSDLPTSLSTNSFNVGSSKIQSINKTYSTSTSFKVSSNEANSVSWAVNNLYSGSSFQSLWKTELTNLSKSPDYISIQILAAKKIYSKALTYYNRLGVKELRSFLMMFDVVVQNGSFYEQNWSDYNTWLKSNSNATATQKLTKLIDIRIANVNSKWQSDVRSRKYAIISGQGTVHGSQRKFNQEYCYQNNWNFL